MSMLLLKLSPVHSPRRRLGGLVRCTKHLAGTSIVLVNCRTIDTPSILLSQCGETQWAKRVLSQPSKELGASAVPWTKSRKRALLFHHRIRETRETALPILHRLLRIHRCDIGASLFWLFVFVSGIARGFFCLETWQVL